MARRRAVALRLALCASFVPVALAQSGLAPNYVPLADARRVLVALPAAIPHDLPSTSGVRAGERWLAWAAGHDRAIRRRLRDGDEETLLNWLFLGQSFTALPPVRLDANASERAAQAAEALIRARVDALVLALGAPGNDERRQWARAFLAGQGQGFATPRERVAAGNHLLQAIQRLFQGAAQPPPMGRSGVGATPTSQFERRGLSLDTAISPNFAIDQSLQSLTTRRHVAAGTVRRVAIIGAGLDFADKNTGFDFYPVQTLQPFAVLDTLRRLRLAPPAADVEIVALDISARVLTHIARARAADAGYLLHLPLARSDRWLPALRSYWDALGGQIGTSVASTGPPSVDMRTVRVPQAVVETLVTEDVNVIVARSRLARFDLIVATNVLLYYGPFDQALALTNIESMLNVGGLFLTNTSLPDVAGSSLRRIGSQVTLYTTDGRGDEVAWYQRVAGPAAAPD